MKFAIKGVILGTLVASIGISTVMAADVVTQAPTTTNPAVMEASAAPTATASALKQVPSRDSGSIQRGDAEELTAHELATAPTNILLDGLWMSKDYEMTSIFKFTKEGSVYWVTKTDKSDDFLSGKYVVDENHMVIATYDYHNGNGKATKLVGEKVMPVAMHIDIAQDDQSFEWNDENYPITFKRVTTVPVNFNNYLKTVVTADKDLTTGNVTSEAIIGDWVATSGNSTIEYMFDDKGNVGVKSTNKKDQNSTIIFTGKYTIENGTMDIHYNYIEVNANAMKLMDNNGMDVSNAIFVAADGKSWTWAGDKNPIVFKRDTTPLVLVKAPTNTTYIVPTKQLLNNAWISTDEKNATTKYFFDQKNKVYTQMSANGVALASLAGTYTLEGNKVTAKYNYINTDGKIQNLPVGEEIVAEFNVHFADNGRTWVTGDRVPVKFAKDVGDIDWIAKP